MRFGVGASFQIQIKVLLVVENKYFTYWFKNVTCDTGNENIPVFGSVFSFCCLFCDQCHAVLTAISVFK